MGYKRCDCFGGPTMQDFTTNQELMSSAGPGDVIRIDGKQLPPILAQAGAEAWRHVVEYFTAHIRNPNTRAAYSRADGATSS